MTPLFKSSNMRYILFFTILFFGCKEKESKPTIPFKVILHTQVDTSRLKLEVYKFYGEINFKIEYLPNDSTIIDYLGKWSAISFEDTTKNDTVVMHIVKDTGDGMTGFARATKDEAILKEFPIYYRDLYIQAKGLRNNTIVHELGHMYGLGHTFDESGMWGITAYERKFEKYEYNYMSYDCHTDNFTPYQLNIINKFKQIRHGKH